MDCGIYWGTHPFMTEDDVGYIVATVTKYFRESDQAGSRRQQG